MIDRPRGPGSGSGSGSGSDAPREGSAEYEWLYGDGTSTPRPDEDHTRAIPTAHKRAASAADQRGDDHTKVLPTMPPTSAPRPEPRRTATTTPPTPPQRPRDSERAGRPRRPRRVGRWLVALPALWLAFLIAVPLWTWSKIDKVDAAPAGDRPESSAGTNYLIVGSDKADDLSQAQRKALKTGPRGGTNTDTIIVLHTGAGQNTMMSIPRDTLTEIPGHGTGMINSAFALGKAPLLVATVERLTKLRIDHYVEMGFGSVINTVDALGGVKICPKQDMKDPLARLDIKKGCQEVDGMTALAYSRSRHVTALSDLDRVARQREVISALGDKGASPLTFLNPFRYWNLSHAAGNSIRIDQEMGPFDLTRFVLAMRGQRLTCTMPNLPAPSDPNRIVIDEDRARPLLDAIRNGDTIPKANCTPTGRARS